MNGTSWLHKHCNILSSTPIILITPTHSWSCVLACILALACVSLVTSAFLPCFWHLYLYILGLILSPPLDFKFMVYLELYNSPLHLVALQLKTYLLHKLSLKSSCPLLSPFSSKFIWHCFAASLPTELCCNSIGLEQVTPTHTLFPVPQMHYSLHFH